MDLPFQVHSLPMRCLCAANNRWSNKFRPTVGVLLRTLKSYQHAVHALCFALLVFPVSVVRTGRQLKIAILVFILLVVHRVIVFVSVGASPLEPIGLEYILTTIIWTSNYVHFKIKNLYEPNKGHGRIANLSALLLMLHTGFNWFIWVGVFARSDYFYFEDVRMGLDASGSFSEYFWLSLSHINLWSCAFSPHHSAFST